MDRLTHILEKYPWIIEEAKIWTQVAVLFTFGVVTWLYVLERPVNAVGTWLSTWNSDYQLRKQSIEFHKVPRNVPRPPVRMVSVCGAARLDTTRRVGWFGSSPCFLGWPSNKGIITLNLGDIKDFDALCIDRANLPQVRFEDQDEEDAFCQLMLLAGGEWWYKTEMPQLLRANMWPATTRW